MVALKTLAEFKSERQEALDRQEAIEKEARDKTKGVMTAEQLKEYKELDEQVDNLDKCIEDCEETEKMIAKSQQRRQKEAVNRRRTTGASDPLAGRVGEVKDNFIDDPKKGFKSHNDFLMAVMNHGRGLGANDHRLNYLAAVGSDEARTNSDPAGGFLTPEQWTPNLMRLEAEDDPMGGLTTKVPMGATIVKMPSRVDRNHTSSVSGGLTVTRRPETVAGTASQMTFEQIALEAHNLFGLSYATEELLTDSAISFVALLSTGFSEQFTSHIINERLNGTGVGEFLGILNSACPATLSISAETGQAADTIVFENVLKMRARCYGYGKAIWMANHDCLPQLMLMNQSIGTGGVPVWQPSAREDHPDMLLGRPLILTEYCNAIGDSGDIILANWSQYLEGIYQPLQSAESMHVRFVNHERTFKFWLRNAGMPWWKDVFTPKNGATMAPFLKLAAR